MNKLELRLLRGLPGSGKSTLAKTLDLVHIEADQFFVNDDNEYYFEGSLLSSAHQWCQSQCEFNLYHGRSVVVANTFVKQWEMDAYRKIAQQYNAELIIDICRGKFKSIHNVPENVIKRMKKDWEV
ncbi:MULTISPECIES: ATP-binding protein [unclassified Aliivibrio]|uniref:ATP-binding protein n=1 Tax=unclassified Aliivibrio TaxID=2645654 RepID=UPI00080EC233|nr:MULTISPECIES: ATP-binding protein [unclassified Aliivibrio]OCH14450.1 AAA family ATPase [Aliivibrio sp. 1S128]OCH16447.1 AAA family ATPase [Aliivibrio sp. 1S165]OCH33884.1 AAA family ATPase [Aliivibrio sp. 1S175]